MAVAMPYAFIVYKGFQVLASYPMYPGSEREERRPGYEAI